jgi:PAS domain S-box-containing protein
LTLTPITEVIATFGGRSAAANVDVALIDCSAPGINAPQIVSQLRALRLPIPIVLVLDPGAENGAAMALSLEGDDYTVKTPGWLGRLPVRLQIVVSRYRRLYELEVMAAREQRIRMAVERAPVCIGRIFDDGSIGAMNDAALKMLAADSPADVLKKPFAEFVVPSHHQALTEFVAVVCGGEARSVELSIVPKQGDQRIMEVRGVAMPPDSDGRPSAIIALRDLSERRRLEASVLEVSAADQVAERGAEATFAAEIAALRQRLADAEIERQQVAHDRDAQQQSAAAASLETERLNALLAAREQSAAAALAETERLNALLVEREQSAAAASAETERLNALLAEREQSAAAASAETERLNALLAEREQSAAAASAETERLNVLLAEREQPVQAGGDLERAYQDARTQAEEAVRALEHQRQQAAAAAQQAANALEEQRQLREAIEQRLDVEEQRRFAEVVERNAESERAAQLSKECEALRATLDQQTRSADALEQERRALEQERHARELAESRCTALDADRHTYMGRIQELERRQQEQGDANHALEQERRARETAESRLSDLERRISVEIGAVEALRAHCSALDQERQRLVAAVEQSANREAAERHAREAQAAASAAAPDYDAMMREQAATIESLTTQLRDAETACQRATSERADRDQACRVLEAELRQSVEARRTHRQELLAALTEVQQFEDLAARHFARCTELERRLSAAKAEFDELTAWAVTRAARAAEALK